VKKVIKRTALVLSTTPPIPREYGNRNRVFQTISFLEGLGFSVSFLLYPFDEEWEVSIPTYYKELSDRFEYFSVIPNKRRLHQGALGRHHEIDEWWDETIGDHLSWLFKRQKYDVFFVNYTFFSRAFEYAPAHTLRILDTHDLFTGRREAFEKFGVDAEFFYTTADEERKAFDRADAIIGIKEAESAYIRTLTQKTVITVPYWADDVDKDAAASPERAHVVFSHDRPLKLGFIGAQNSVNVVNMRRFLHLFDRYVRLYDLPVEVVVAGNVCRQLHTTYSFVRLVGRVPDIADFYGAIDAVIAPLEFSTGIKIKVGEALARGLPVLATENAFDGFRAYSSFQVEKDVPSLCRTLARLATNEIKLADVSIASRRAATAAAKARDKGFAELKSWIHGKTRRIVVITDRPFWYRGTWIDELIAQSIEYVSNCGKTIVLSMSGEAVKPSGVYSSAQYISGCAVNDIEAVVRQIGESCRIAGIIAFLDSADSAKVLKGVDPASVQMWIGQIDIAPRRASVKFLPVHSGAAEINVAPLRYLPARASKTLNVSQVTILSPDSSSEWEKTVIGHIEDQCRAHSLQLQTIRVPSYAQYDPDFMGRCTGDTAQRVIVLESDRVSRLFVPHLTEYRGAQCLILGPTVTCPLAISANERWPSVMTSIESFLTSAVSARPGSDANSGWDHVWAALA